MNQSYVGSLVAILILILFGIIVVIVKPGWLYETRDGNNATSTPTSTPTSTIPISGRFSGKIVYTTETNQDPARFKSHCESLGGTFNTCGNVCAPDADICVQVCAFTCTYATSTEK